MKTPVDKSVESSQTVKLDGKGDSRFGKLTGNAGPAGACGRGPGVCAETVGSGRGWEDEDEGEEVTVPDVGAPMTTAEDLLLGGGR